MSRFIKISGLTGSGKSTVCDLLSTSPGFENSIFIHQDDYFKTKKPMIALSNGAVVANYDCPEAIDIPALNLDIKTALKTGHMVILEGFMLRDDLISFQTDIHIHLSYTSENALKLMSPEDLYTILIKRAIVARSQTKRGAKYEECMLKDVILPAYLITLKTSSITHVISVYDDTGKRVDKGRIMENVRAILSNF